eukprot:479780-Pleurochrysis_carterae.AAC.1
MSISRRSAARACLLSSAAQSHSARRAHARARTPASSTLAAPFSGRQGSAMLKGSGLARPYIIHTQQRELSAMCNGSRPRVALDVAAPSRAASLSAKRLSVSKKPLCEQNASL